MAKRTNCLVCLHRSKLEKELKALNKELSKAEDELLSTEQNYAASEVIDRAIDDVKDAIVKTDPRRQKVLNLLKSAFSMVHKIEREYEVAYDKADRKLEKLVTRKHSLEDQLAKIV